MYPIHTTLKYKHFYSPNAPDSENGIPIPVTHEREEKECNEHVCTRDNDMVMEMVRLLASQSSGEQDAHHNTSNNNNTDSSFNLPALQHYMYHHPVSMQSHI